MISFTVNLDVADARWVVLRITDREQSADGRAADDFSGFGGAIAYTSPFFLQPA